MIFLKEPTETVEAEPVESDEEPEAVAPAPKKILLEEPTETDFTRKRDVSTIKILTYAK